MLKIHHLYPFVDHFPRETHWFSTSPSGPSASEVIHRLHGAQSLPHAAPPGRSTHGMSGMCLKSQDAPCFMGKWSWAMIHVYIYIYIGIVSLRASVLSPFRSSWTRTLLGGLWNVHNSYETCTTSMERAQLLWNVRNSYETFATSMIYISSQTLQKALNDTIPIYIYIYMY